MKLAMHFAPEFCPKAFPMSQGSTTRRTIAVLLSSLLLISALSPAAEARSRHKARGAHAHNGSHMEGDRSAQNRRNDKRLKSAADEADKLLNTRIKSICRGC